MGKIVLLDELTINQIAAGEVIERPASVIKEMVENSIDAGAKNITVEIKKGGIDLIKITDDGCGISEDDMEIAFERHATSKIRSSSDLETVTTMGFRGEALASIAAISKVTMVSKTEDDDIGHKIVVEGGETKEKAEIGCQKGTTITVENLFYNTPVRYKFLRKDYTEAGYIEDVVTRLALVNKDVSIKLINSGKTVIQTNGNGDIQTTIYSIYGKDVANGIVEVNYDYEDIHIEGVVGKPEIARGNRGYQLFFVNDRYVKDKNLTAGADKAYKDILPIGKFGFLVLNISMDPKDVDVNVHPAKLEVRFSDESMMFRAVYHAIKSVLDTIPATSIPFEKNRSGEQVEDAFSTETNAENVAENKQSTDKVAENKQSAFSIGDPKDSVDDVDEPTLFSIGKNKKEEVDFSEKIFGNKKDKFPKSESYETSDENNVEKEMVQPKIRGGGISGFFKKVMGNSEEDRVEYHQDNLVETLFEERHGKKRTTPIFEENVEETDEERHSPQEEKEENIFETLNKPKKDETKNFFDLNFESDMPKASIDGEPATETDEEDHSPQEEKEEAYSFDSITPGLDTSATEEIPVVNDVEETETKESESVISRVESKIAEIQSNISEPELEMNDNNGRTIRFGNIALTSETIEPIGEINNEDHIDEEPVAENKRSAFSTEEDEDTVAENKEKTFSTEENEDSFSTDEPEFDKVTDTIVKGKIEDNVSTQFVDIKTVNEELAKQESEKKEITPEFAEMYKKTFGKDISKRPETKDDNAIVYNEFLYSTEEDNVNVFDETEQNIPERKYTYIGNVFNSYLIIEMDKHMYIIDQRLAYEKIIFERLKESYYNSDARDSQILLLPDIIILNKKQAVIADENREMFEKAGFGFEEFGENTLKLYAVPGLCEKLNTKQLFCEILDGLDSVSIISNEEKEQKFISIISNKAAIKANINLDESEIIDVINQLLSLENPFVCADGKSVAIKMSKIDFEKKFSRR